MSKKKPFVAVTINNPALAAAMGHKEGDVIQVETKGGVPTNREWRNRFNDSKIDGCISIAENVPKKPKKEA